MAGADEKDETGPSVKDPAMYDALRDEGASKGKAAAISNAAAATSREEVGSRGGESPPYEQWTVEQLHRRAGELDVEGRSTMTKDELIAALRR